MWKVKVKRNKRIMIFEAPVMDSNDKWKPSLLIFLDTFTGRKNAERIKERHPERVIINKGTTVRTLLPLSYAAAYSLKCCLNEVFSVPENQMRALDEITESKSPMDERQ